ncbi:TetR/AcrR family transcriptional regulator [Mycobacterium kyogaense]|uniref:TetR/AcrR family transcriptional regulator n=1 Tax=Mycobacterium kyogaense TaxID=2212479 RepID=UPI000DAEDB3A|nr:TetR/AcrR family transcriptional regulator [Mycobacterium kyogaense]
MTSTTPRPLRADAARNRSKLLATAADAFSTRGLGISMDDIARTAGVGAGTLYRHFPTKDHLVAAVLDERIRELAREGRELLDLTGPREALFMLLRKAVLEWGPTDRGLVESLASAVGPHECVPRSAREDFASSVDVLLRAARDEGVVRADVTSDEVETLIVGCQAMQHYRPELAERTLDIMLDGLRTN